MSMEVSAVPAVDSRESMMMLARKKALINAFLALVFCLIIAWVILQNNQYDPMVFTWSGTVYAENDYRGSLGYDGQFAYYIARYGTDAVEIIARADTPAFRYQRWLYPLLARLLSLGQPDLIPWTLLGINILAHVLGTALLTYLLVSRGMPGFGGLIYAFWMGNLHGVFLDLNEPLCFALALAAVLAYVHRRYGWVVLLLILSTASKELGLVIAAGLTLHAIYQREWKWAALIMGLPLFVFVAWAGILTAWLGQSLADTPATGVGRLPLSGLLAEESPLELLMLIVWLVLPIVVMLLLGLRHIWREKRLDVYSALLLPGAAFPLFMPPQTWTDPLAAYRVASTLIITSVLFVGIYMPRQMRWLGALWLPSLLVFVLMIGVLRTPA